MIKFWILDAWTTTSGISVLATGAYTGSYTSVVQVKTSALSSWPASVCGDPAKSDLPSVKLMMVVPYVGPGVTLQINGQTTSGTIPQFGLRDIKLTWIPSGIPLSARSCGISYPANLLSSTTCASFANQYLSTTDNLYHACDESCDECYGGTSSDCYSCNTHYYYDGSQCTACDTSCRDCLTAGATQCLSCNFGYLYSNSTCINRCDPPYVQSVQNNITYCTFPCSSGQYAYANGSCLVSCSSPFVRYTDISNRICNFPCNSTSYYFYSTSSCVSTCNSPLQIITQGGYHYCKYPCLSNEYLYANGSCKSACTPPLQSSQDSGTNKYCLNPCANTTSPYLYWNGSCKTQCAYPLTQINNTDGQLCIYHCNSGQYLYWNQSCLNTCPAPLTNKTEAGNNYCFLPCSTADYLYWNESCLSSCDTPFLKHMKDGINYCSSPCSSSQYLTPSGVCLDSCDAPMIAEQEADIMFCNGPCQDPSSFYYPTIAACKVNCPSPNTRSKTQFYTVCQSVASATQSLKTVEQISSFTTQALNLGLLAGTISSSGSVNSITVAIFAKMLQYIRYIDIKYSNDLVQTLQTHQYKVLSFTLNLDMSDQQKKKFVLRPIPTIFTKWDVHSSFFVNYFSELFSLIIPLVLYILLSTLEFFTKSRDIPRIYSLMRKLRLQFQGLLISLLYVMHGEILMFAIIDFRSTVLSDPYAKLSFGVAIILLLAGWAVLGLNLSLLIKLRGYLFKSYLPIEVKHQRFKEFLKQYHNFSVFFKEFKYAFWSQQSFLLVFMLRDAIINIVLAIFYKYPFAEVTIILVLNVLMLTYHFIRRPIKHRLEQVQEVFCELTLLFVNVCVFVMGVHNNNSQQAQNNREVCSLLIIAVNYLFSFVVLIFVVFKALNNIKEWIKARNVAKAKRRQSMPDIITPGYLTTESHPISYNISLKESSFKPRENNTEKLYTVQKEDSRRSSFGPRIFLEKSGSFRLSNIETNGDTFSPKRLSTFFQISEESKAALGVRVQRRRTNVLRESSQLLDVHCTVNTEEGRASPMSGHSDCIQPSNFFSEWKRRSQMLENINQGPSLGTQPAKESIPTTS